MEQDTSIIELCQRGHPAGFTRLVAAYQERVYRTAYSFLHDREEARDATQEVLLRTVRAIGSLDKSRPLWPWLRRVTTNVALTLLKRRTSHLSLESLPESAQPVDGSGEPSWTLLDLQGALAQLPPLWRVVLTLRHQEGLAYEEIARLTDLPVGTVKTYLFRGRRMLREKLALQEV
ncbi:MAG: RNA polymerase sigma factor [Bacillota bacterium]